MSTYTRQFQIHHSTTWCTWIHFSLKNNIQTINFTGKKLTNFTPLLFASDWLYSYCTRANYSVMLRGGIQVQSGRAAILQRLAASVLQYTWIKEVAHFQASKELNDWNLMREFKHLIELFWSRDGSKSCGVVSSPGLDLSTPVLYHCLLVKMHMCFG